LLYVLMGCMIVIAFRPLIRNVPAEGLFWLAAGGLLYIGGVFFYLRDRKNRFNHVIWHLFVLAGSICHFFAIFFHVLPH
jgi:hemolysin III